MNLTQVRTHINKVLGLVLLTAGSAAAQQTISVDPIYVHIDAGKKLVLINAPVQRLLPTSDPLQTITTNGHTFTFAQPITRISHTTSYQATAHEVTYQVYFSQVPVLELSTHNQITDSPSVYAKLELTDTTGVLARTATGIEYRGAFSQQLPKKSYELSLWADTLGTADQDLALLGMRSDNKWNLQALYNDQLRTRLKVANELWQEINNVYYQAKEPDAKNGIALAYTEVFLNGSYQGIYTLTERIDRKQLKLKKYSGGIKGELYKGVVYDVATGFTGVPAADNTSLLWGGFEYKEPSEETNWTNLHDFVGFVVNSSDADFYSQYKSRFNVDNAVDYYLFLNLMRATDNVGKNVYIAKYKVGEPYFYAPWDLDGVLGNIWDGSNQNVTNDLLSNGFYDRLTKDYSATGFRAALTSRWANLRNSVFTQEHITEKLAVNTAYLMGNNVYEREHLAWPAYHYEAAQFTYPTTWLANRLAYLDGIFGFNLNQTTLGTTAATTTAGPQLYPNPARDYVYVDNSGGQTCQVAVQDVRGKTVLQATLTGHNNRLDISGLPLGVYLVKLASADATTVRKLLVQ